jgi:2,5-diketo-D-gluconate reductase A
MPLVGLGIGALTGSQCYRAVRYALEVGDRHLDTATMYDNEHEVGQAVRDSSLPREEVFVPPSCPQRPRARSGARSTTASGRFRWTTWTCG